jgi:hypothetical protein
VLYTFRMDNYSCGHHRVLWPAEAIDPDGGRISHVSPGEEAGFVTAQVVNGKVNGLRDIPTDMTAILLQRPTSLTLGQCIPFLRGEGIRVIIDVDDDLELLSPRHPSWRILNSHPDHSAKVLRQACRHADVVVCSTPQIKDRLAPTNGVVVRNRLPASHFKATPDLEYMALHPYTYETHVAWPASIGTHPDDGQEVGNALALLRQPVRVVGPASTRGKSVLGADPIYDGEVAFDNWIPRISTIHTGIAPLNSSGFSQAKSALKPLELAVAGVPHVRSRTPEFELLGAGLPADGKREWLNQLKTLTTDEVARKDEVARNFAIAEANCYDLAEVKDEWNHAWFDAFS